MLESVISRGKGIALAGAVGLALAGGSAATLAQEEAATPAAGTPTAEETAPAPESALGAAEKSALAGQIQTLTDAIASVQADRDAVAAQFDMAEVDRLIAKATELRDAAQTALDGDDPSAAPESVFVGIATANAARGLIEAEAAAYGLPSQQAAASRVLVGAYYAIDEVNARQVASPDQDAAFYVDTAKTLYARAHEQYTAGTYAQAAATARVAAEIGHIAGLAGEDKAFGANERMMIPPDGGRPGFAVEIPDGRMEGGDFRGGYGRVEMLPPGTGPFDITVGGRFDPAFAHPSFSAMPAIGGGANDTPVDVPEPTFD